MANTTLAQHTVGKSNGDALERDPQCQHRFIYRHAKPFHLKHGGVLPHLDLAYELTGPQDGELVIVMGGISAGRHLYAHDGDPSPGWWPAMVGPGLAIDSKRYRILGFDFLGGTGQSTGPNAKTFSGVQSVSTYDQAMCLILILDHLGVDKVHAIVGSSYGGMVALALGERYPERVERLLILSAAHGPEVMATAWRSLQRNIVRLGLSSGDLDRALGLARGLAMTTYRSRCEFTKRFDGAPRLTDKGYLFPVEEYLDARGRDFSSHFHPEAFICLSESIDLHRVEPSQVHVATTLIAVATDRLVPPQLMRQLSSSLAGPNELVEINSLYGHDAFLKEPEVLTPILTRALNQEVAA